MKDCIFCKIINGEIPSRKVYEDDNVIVIMDADPKVDGHSLIIPKKHITDFTELSNEDIINIQNIAKKVGINIMNKLNATGLTCGINYGDSQAVKHFHMHILPNYLIKDKSNKDLDEIYNIIKED